MGIMQRRKGKAGEREAAAMLRELLDVDLRRNLDQARDGGRDLVGMEAYAIEVKRAAVERLGDWWAQTINQAEETRQRPLLLFRLDRRPWRALIALSDFLPGYDNGSRSIEHTAEIGLDALAVLLRSERTPI